MNVSVTSRSVKEPPNLRESVDSRACCGTCEMFDHEKSVCWGYGNKSVDADDVCDSWSKETKTSSIIDEILSRPTIPLESIVRVGGATADWLKNDDGTATVLTDGGDYLDRQYARDMMTSQLLYHGYKIAEYPLPQQYEYYDHGDPVDPGAEWWTDHLFHVAPAEDRERIQAHGLQPVQPRDSGNWPNAVGRTYPPGVYGFPEGNDALNYKTFLEAKRGKPHDVWALPVASNTWHRDTDIDGAFYSPKEVTDAFLCHPEANDLWDEKGNRDQWDDVQNLSEYPSQVHNYQNRISSFDKMADWNAVMTKAKRLAQSGNVRLLRNGYNYIVANVQGDHDNYEVEISRQDPQSRAITGWSCSCQWADHSFDRTRKWRKYESRPCSHVLATYWKSLGTPLDDSPEGQPPTPGQRTNPLPGQPRPGQTPGQAGPGGHGGAPLDVREPAGGDRSFGPDDEGAAPAPQPGPMNMPQGPSPMQDTPIAPGRGVIPPFPGAQMEQWQNWQGPGTTDGGQESPPWAVSVPGAKQPTPFNPLQLPGTYSAWRVEASYQVGDVVQLTQDIYMNTDSNLQGNWQLIPARRPDGRPQSASVRDVDPTTGFVQIWVSLDDNSFNQPAYAYGYVNPEEIKPSRATNDPTAPRRVR